MEHVDAHDYIDQANESWKQGDKYKAIALVTKAIQVNPNDYVFHLIRAEFYLQLEQYDQAWDDYTKLINDDPNLINTYKYRASTYESMGKYALAIKDFSTIIQLGEASAENFAFRGYLHELNQDYQEAVKDYDRAIQIENNNEWYLKRGEVSLVLGEYMNAVKDFTRVIGEKYRLLKALWGRGVGYLYLNEYDFAIADFTMAINIMKIEYKNMPLNAEYYFLRGIGFEKKGEIDNAFNDYRKALLLNFANSKVANLFNSLENSSK
jgi:Tfp pilus assembly protein PilF